MILKILLSGDGGQGIQLIADMICRVSFEAGWHVTSIPNYGLEQRGGVSLNFIQISDKKIVYPKFSKPDVLLIMSSQARERTEEYQKDSKDIKILDIKEIEDNLKKNNVSMQSYNVFCLGMITKILEEKNICKKEDVFTLIEKKLSTKLGWEENKRVWGFSILN
ncbi:MAG TPA: hypothetical protein DCS29_01800 [Candidatus Magasanikbacteria bacterium]|nr:MAG: hypothetical protein A2479_01370 [Candidatus Magasanikbacteria bacterium RIFOXYC2_FULL_39_8]HAT03491.1 hypothetical protein [Candidatus Magasanikbacteria bacterium]